MIKPSPLSPLGGRATGKAQSVWTATSDLKRRWPVSMMIWGAIVTVLTLGGQRAPLCISVFARADLGRAHQNETESVAADCESTECRIVHFVSRTEDQH